MRYFTITMIAWFTFFMAAAQPFDNYQETIESTGLTFEMVAVQGGVFKMGSPESEPGRQPDEEPLHEVRVDDFWLATHEVTWDLYERFMYREKTGEAFSSRMADLGIDVDGISGATQPYTDMSFGMGKEGFPATNITQYAAISFCKWLSAKTGNFYRLPTEAEWEYACKKGLEDETETTLTDKAWFKQNSPEGYKRVGEKAPNAIGIFDMLGNVAEWTLDQYVRDFYSQSSEDNPWAYPTQLYPRSLRGGSWREDASAIRCGARRGSDPKWKRMDPQLPKSRWWHTSAPFVGFRVLRPHKTPPPEEIEKYWLEPMDDY